MHDMAARSHNRKHFLVFIKAHAAFLEEIEPYILPAPVLAVVHEADKVSDCSQQWNTQEVVDSIG